MLELAVLELAIFALKIAGLVAVIWLIVKLVRKNRK
jgi:hypothetical protein